jgi:Na+/H+ antiporter NhaC
LEAAIPTEPTHFGVLSLLPAVVALGLAIGTKRVIESLLLGILSAVVLLDARATGWLHSLLYSIPNLFAAIAGHPPDAASGSEGIGLVKSSGRAELLVIVVLLGAFIAVLERSGGALAFGEWLSGKVNGPRGAQNASAIMGCALFTSAYFSALATGTVFRPIFDRMRLSRAKLAFILDSTSAPVNTLVPISGWVAFMAALLHDNIPGLDDGVRGLLRTVPFNFYCWTLLTLVFLRVNNVVREIGPMRRSEERAAAGECTADEDDGAAGELDARGGKGRSPAARRSEATDMTGRAGTVMDMVLPLGTSIAILVFLGLWNFTLADPELGLGLPKVPINSNQILIFSFSVGLLVAGIKYGAGGLMKPKEFLDETLEGSKSVVIGGMIIILAVTLGDVLRSSPPDGLGAEAYLGSVARGLIPVGIVPLAAFVISSFMGFALGTAFGVWGIMIPLTIPIGGNPYVVAAAVLSGGTFGDHCSPISDTTIMSSIGAGCDHMEHVTTQLPYALTAAGLSAFLFLLAGFVA